MYTFAQCTKMLCVCVAYICVHINLHARLHALYVGLFLRRTYVRTYFCWVEFALRMCYKALAELERDPTCVNVIVGPGSNLFGLHTLHILAQRTSVMFIRTGYSPEEYLAFCVDLTCLGARPPGG